MKTQTMLLQQHRKNDVDSQEEDHNDNDEDDYYYDCGGLVQPKTDCPHIHSHVKFRVVNGEMMMMMLALSSCQTLFKTEQEQNDDDKNDKGQDQEISTETEGRTDTNREMLKKRRQNEEEEEVGMLEQKFQRWHFNTSEGIFLAPCQHFQCFHRYSASNRNLNGDGTSTKDHYTENDGIYDEMMMIPSGGENDDTKSLNTNDVSDTCAGEETDDNAKDTEEQMTRENWLCLECGLLHCSRYQFGHAKWHYETTKDLQRIQLQDVHKISQVPMEEKILFDDVQKDEGRANNNNDTQVAEGHCVAVSLSDLSVWCYECNAYLCHPVLQELTAHLEWLKFGDGCDPIICEEAEKDIRQQKDDREEKESKDMDEKVSEQSSTVVEDDNKLLTDTIHREASSFSNSIHKRKGIPTKRSAPEDSHNIHDWSYQKFKAGGEERRGSGVESPDSIHDDDDDDGDDDDEEEIAALIESQHGEMLRAYLARHESFDTSQMGQCVPMHTRPPSFPDEVADFLRSPLCKSIIVLAGAGMSVSCGIPDFRSVGIGLYDTLQPELLTASPEEREIIGSDPTLALDKRLFLYNPLPMLETKRSFILGTHEKRWKATLAHRFVELLHTKLGKLTRLYTQNIDGLELQTSIPKKKVVNVHGSMGAAACEVCGHRVDFDDFCTKVRSNIKDITGKDLEAPAESTPIICDACGQPTMKPDIVLFASSLPKKFFTCAAEDLPSADLLIVMGTSLSVAPANSLVYRIPPTAVRLAMNNEPVGRQLGIDYSDSAIRDVWAEGSTDESCLSLAEKMGWLNDLELIMNDLPEKSASLLRDRLAQTQIMNAKVTETLKDNEDSCSKPCNT